MSIANTEQAEHWNTGEDVGHWISNQARYDRMLAPFTAMILDAADLRPGQSVLDDRRNLQQATALRPLLHQSLLVGRRSRG